MPGINSHSLTTFHSGLYGLLKVLKHQLFDDLLLLATAQVLAVVAAADSFFVRLEIVIVIFYSAFALAFAAFL